VSRCAGSLRERAALAASEHQWADPIEEGFGYTVGWQCRCGAEHVGDDAADTGEQWHAAHQADAVLAVVREWLASEGAREGVAKALQAACDESWLTLKSGESAVEINHDHDAAFALAALIDRAKEAHL